MTRSRSRNTHLVGRYCVTQTRVAGCSRGQEKINKSTGAQAIRARVVRTQVFKKNLNKVVGNETMTINSPSPISIYFSFFIAYIKHPLELSECLLANDDYLDYNNSQYLLSKSLGRKINMICDV